VEIDAIWSETAWAYFLSPAFPLWRPAGSCSFWCPWAVPAWPFRLSSSSSASPFSWARCRSGGAFHIRWVRGPRWMRPHRHAGRHPGGAVQDEGQAPGEGLVPSLLRLL